MQVLEDTELIVQTSDCESWVKDCRVYSMDQSSYLFPADKTSEILCISGVLSVGNKYSYRSLTLIANMHAVIISPLVATCHLNIPSCIATAT